jgi:hypothetical protein
MVDYSNSIASVAGGFMPEAGWALLDLGFPSHLGDKASSELGFQGELGIVIPQILFDKSTENQLMAFQGFTYRVPGLVEVVRIVGVVIFPEYYPRTLGFSEGSNLHHLPPFPAKGDDTRSGIKFKPHPSAPFDVP